METTRWINPTQPQTLQSSVILLYLTAILDAVFGGLGGIVLLLAVGRVAGGWGIANERKWGYQLAVGMAVLPFVALFAFNSLGSIADNLLTVLLSMAFDIVLLVLLLHEQSRSYQRIWFK
jgi:hypothetical protein